MTARYDKVIVHEDEAGKVDFVVIFNEKLHLPVFYGTDGFGMDEVLEILGGRASKEPIKDVQIVVEGGKKT